MRDPRQRRSHVGRGSGDLRQRVQTGQRVEDRTRWGQQPVELAQDDGALDVGAKLLVARDLRRHGRRDPDDCEPERSAEDRSEHAVEQAQAGHHERASQPKAQPLETGGEHHAGEQRADQAKRGGVGRRRAFREQQRAQAGSQERPDRESSKR